MKYSKASCSAMTEVLNENTTCTKMLILPSVKSIAIFIFLSVSVARMKQFGYHFKERRNALDPQVQEKTQKSDSRL